MSRDAAAYWVLRFAGMTAQRSGVTATPAVYICRPDRLFPWPLGLPLRATVFIALSASLPAVRRYAETASGAPHETMIARHPMIWRTTSARIATWFGFVLMCLGMFMAILDIQVVATSLPAIQHALAISPDAMSWIQTAYLIAEITAIPLTGWLTRVLTLRWLFVIAIFVFTVTSVGCAFSDQFRVARHLPHPSGFCGRHADPRGVLRHLSVVSGARPSDRRHHRRHRGRAGADGRAGGRRLDHRTIIRGPGCS